ncbi:hypothetical protein COU95_01030 [Candidatus Shapirobacteria bacterium CG10_big_fil_rev_8_21_14_0_10_40_9]|uniref:Uncharacterized protein n=1 Tax=Candidatus Shapirobacteria bacterium CG10_big_fil_rev_8_21_14_0_10_40_9 TaxID=1974888 RepID=A0A2M8L430_9BACT|nr:MAG: hypothetical protein COU95_01030 [Candidatus Shapirobacteria bacterium CG10_big_fil_rev_8_21_14_0_10_40_9]
MGFLLLAITIAGVCLGTLGGLVAIGDRLVNVVLPHRQLIPLPFWVYLVAVVVGIVAFICNIKVFGYIEYLEGSTGD